MVDCTPVLADIVRDWKWAHPIFNDIVIHKGHDDTVIIKGTHIYGLIDSKSVIFGNGSREPAQRDRVKVLYAHDINFFDDLHTELNKLIQDDAAWRTRACWDPYAKYWTRMLQNI